MRSGALRTARDVLEEISGYRDFLRRAKGGVTISGGEPLMQAAFLQSLFEGCKRMGLHTALDTSGYLGHLASDEMLDAVDLVILDIKAGDDARHRQLTGKPLAPTLDFARRLAAKRKPTWVRFVLVPGVTDAEDNIRGIARLVSGLDSVERVEILPFHQLGLYKWRELGLAYALEDTPAASKADVARARAIFADAGVTAR
jgi:pyruvate formate lyase activating enzyme